MRIFQVIDESTNTSVPFSGAWYRNLCEPLLDLGCDVTFVSARPGRIARQRGNSSLRGRFTQNVLDTFKREHQQQPYDLVFTYLTEGMVDPEFITAVRSAGVPTCNFSCNNTHQFHLVQGIASRFDYFLHSEKPAREKLIEVGATPIWWPMASNPNYFHPLPEKRIYDVTFVGGSYALRARYIQQLLKSQIDVHVFGPGWRLGARTRTRSRLKRWVLLARLVAASSPQTRATASGNLADYDYGRLLALESARNFHDPIPDNHVVALYSQSHVSLGFLEVHDRNDPSQPILRHVHMRDFEAPMCGALYCTGYMQELEHFFEPDKEVVVYRSEDELVDKVRYYLKNTTAAEAIRSAGLRRALAEHTYHRRFRTLFAQIGLSLPSSHSKGTVTREPVLEATH